MYLFLSFYIQLLVSLNLICISVDSPWLNYVVLLIQSDNICLVICLFNPFMFNAIIDTVGFTAAILLCFFI